MSLSPILSRSIQPIFFSVRSSLRPCRLCSAAAVPRRSGLSLRGWWYQTPRAPAAASPIIARPYSTGPAGKMRKNWTFEQVEEEVRTGQEEVVFVDTREPNELKETGRIPGAVNIPIATSPDSFHISDQEFQMRHGFDRPKKNSKLLLYCRSGVRSRAAAGLARDAGWTRVGEYPGSWKDWEANDGPRDKSGQTDKPRQESERDEKGE